MEKKMLAMLLGISMVTMSLAGCSRQASDTSSEKAKESVSEAESAEAEQTDAGDVEQAAEETKDPLGKYEEEITLRGAWGNSGAAVFYPGHEGHESAEDNMYITAYKEELGINVVYDWISEDGEAYKTKWNLAMAQNNLPDFGVVDSNIYMALRDGGLIMDMSEVFEQYASDTYKEWLDADGGIARSYVTEDGKMYGLPFAGSQPDTVQLIYIRQDWLDQLGLEVPATIDELVDVAQAFVDNKLGGEHTYGIAFCDNYGDYDLSYRGFLAGYGVYLNGWQLEDGKVVYGTTRDANKEALLKLQEMYQNGLIAEDFSVSPKETVKESIAAGEVGILYGTFWNGTGTQEAKEMNPDAEWVIAEVPTVDGSPAQGFASASSSNFIFVNKDCEHPEAVVKIMNLHIDKLNNEDPEVVAYYGTHEAPEGEGNVECQHYHAFMGNNVNKPWKNLNRYLGVREILETGNTEGYTADVVNNYNSVKEYMETGNMDCFFQYMVFGPEGTFSIINKMKEEGRITADVYSACPTETMIDKKDLLDEALMAAVYKVIMGEDISVYEKAVEDWYKNGGQIMTDEVNAWYASNH